MRRVEWLRLELLCRMVSFLVILGRVCIDLRKNVLMWMISFGLKLLRDSRTNRVHRTHELVGVVGC